MSIPAQMNSDFENEETEDSCFDMLEDLIRNNPNLRDIFVKEEYFNQAENEMHPRFLTALMKLCALEGLNSLMRHLA